MTSGRAINLVASTGAEMTKAEIAVRKATVTDMRQCELNFALAERKHEAAKTLKRIFEMYPEFFT